MSVRSSLYYRRGAGGKVAIEDMGVSTGQRLFVCSLTGTDATGYGFTPDKPLATLKYAIALCTTLKQDIIFLMPGHAEALTSATSLDMNVAGVRVIGIGVGRARPRFTITTATTATWNVTAANCLIENVDIVTNFLNVAAAMTVAATGTGLTLRGIRMYDTSVILGALIGISVAADADDLTIDDFRYYGIHLTAHATSCIACAGGCDRLSITNAYIHGAFSDAAIYAHAAKSTDILLRRIDIYNEDAATGVGIHVEATTTGHADDIFAFCATDTCVALIGEAVSRTDRVRYTNVVGLSTLLNSASDA